MQPDLIVTFRAEATELLSELESSLLALEQDPTDADSLGRVFRAMHTIKGSSGMAGFAEIVRFTHDVETLLDRVRKGRMTINRELLSLVLAAKDHVHSLLMADPAADEELIATSNALLNQLRPHLSTEVATAPRPGEDQGCRTMSAYWIRYRPSPTALANGTNPLALLEDLSPLGLVMELFHPEDIPDLDQLVADRTYGWWDILLNSDQGEQAIRDVFVFEDAHTYQVRSLGCGAVRKSDLTEMSNLFRTLARQEPEAIYTAVQGHYERVLVEKLQKRRESKEDVIQGSIRVDSGRLDKLVDMVGELVIIQSRLSLLVNRQRDSALEQVAEELERLSTEMRVNALGMRMVPVGASFNAFRRMVRDLAITMGKEVDLLIEGADTELDKTVIDRLKDPLLHILRNAIDHGIESPALRRGLGKPERGTIRLEASSASGDVRLVIVDDGQGIDPGKIRQKAVERGLIALDAELGKRELMGLIFEPGFSTVDRVTDISGRGVGMDVVRKGIDALRGTVELDSTPGKGTTFTIRLPLTLAIIDGLGVRIGGESFVLPLAMVEACQERRSDGSEQVVGSIERVGHLIPCISLRNLMQVPGTPPGQERVIIVKVDGMEVGMAVDRVVGRQQAVIKGLTSIYRDIEWISGSTINGDGGVSLILDATHLVRFAISQWDKGAAARG